MSENPAGIDVHREIQETIAVLVQDGEDGQEPAVFGQEALDAIKDLVDHFLDKGPVLMDAVETVLVVAHVLETEQDSPKAAKQLVAIVDREVVIKAMKALNREKDVERADDVQKTAEEFSKFSAKEDKKTAPKDDEEAPKGSLKLGALDFPKRM